MGLRLITYNLNLQAACNTLQFLPALLNSVRFLKIFFIILLPENYLFVNLPINKPIVDFINDFSLISDSALIHFKGRVLYLVNNIPHFYDCEIAIVTIKMKELDAIFY